MTREVLPKYPIYIISKGRADTIALHTAGFLAVDYVPFRVVIEPQEFDAYAKVIPEDRLLTLPFSNLGQGGTPARNWIWEHSRSEGHESHWILDDNIRRIYRLWYGERIPCDSAPAFRQVEDFVDRFDNIAVAGMNYKMFGLPNLSAYFLNTHVYSCLLIRNDIPFRWRGKYNEDTDLCLQALTSKWCTVLVNVFLADKLPTMSQKGGNTESLYGGLGGRVTGDGTRIVPTTDGRLEMAKTLQRQWGQELVRIDRRWQRPQHVVEWKRFKTALHLKDGVDLAQLGKIDEYGLYMKAWKAVKSERIQKILTDNREKETVS